MENKCIYVDLIDTVDSNLPEIGELVFSVENAINKDIYFSGVQNSGCKLLLNGVTVRYNNVEYSDEVAFPSYGNNMVVRIISSNVGGTVIITNKYKVDYIDIRWCSSKFTTTDLKYCENLADLSLNYTNICGDLSDLVGLPLKTININNTKITGDISALAAKSLTILELGNCFVKGDVTAFLQAQASFRQNGDTLHIYVTQYCTNVPAQIGIDYNHRGIVTFNGQGGYTITNP